MLCSGAPSQGGASRPPDMPAKPGSSGDTGRAAWYDAAYERISEREHPRLRGTVGEDRWRIAREVQASEGPAGTWEASDPDLQDEELEAMLQRLFFLRDNFEYASITCGPYKSGIS